MSTPLRELLNGILFDPSTRAAFSSDPRSFLQQHGWDDLDAVDVHTALTALVDDLPIARAVIVAPAVDTATPNSVGLEGSPFDGAIDGLVAAASTVHPDADLAALHHDLDAMPEDESDDGFDDGFNNGFDSGIDGGFDDGFEGPDDNPIDDSPFTDTAFTDSAFTDTAFTDTALGEIDAGDGLDEPALDDDVNLLDDSPFDDANLDHEAEPIDLDDDGAFGID